ncbi:unnamed protein product [Staurois parvus]|uniref:Ycf15 n=1 Tax=Staurois parvus TaxID=386267 RepID=A0ABN9FB47_9NEOB|nr:unnamed protein product [Staurois parvus]
MLSLKLFILIPERWHYLFNERTKLYISTQERTDHWDSRALPEGPGSVRGPMRCPWHLS